MTTYFPFIKNPQQPFQFTPSLDGTPYNAACLWSLFGKRYYLRIQSLNGPLLFMLPVIGSPPAIPIQILDWENGIVTGTVSVPHQYAIGATIDLMIKNCQPLEYGGLLRCLITNAMQFTYFLPAFPGLATIAGTVCKEINIAGGYVQFSSLIYREGSSTFEVDP